MPNHTSSRYIMFSFSTRMKIYHVNNITTFFSFFLIHATESEGGEGVPWGGGGEGVGGRGWGVR